jgi:uncharacterized protein YcbK (DUF882 family)
MKIKNIEKLNNCNVVLFDMVRDLSKEFGNIRITSGYRSYDDHERIYKQIYGADYKEHMPKSSAHLRGEAVDFVVEEPIHPIKIAAHLMYRLNDYGIYGLGVPLDSWAFHVDITERSELAVWYYDNNGKMIKP